MASIIDGFTRDDLEELIDNNPYLRGYLQGYLAEAVLISRVKHLPHVDSVRKISDSDAMKGDLEVIYKGKPIIIECKSVSGSTVKVDPIGESWVGSVGIKNSDSRFLSIDGTMVKTSSLEKGTFDILAISCFAVDQTWDFLYIENQYLPEKKDTPGFISTKFIVDPKSTACVVKSLSALLEKVYCNKYGNPC